MPDSNKCCICFVNDAKDLHETERLRFTCSHGACMCVACRKACATCNPICPLCRTNITILPPLPMSLQNRYRQLCEEHSYVPRQMVLEILDRIEEMIAQHDVVYVHYTYIPAPLHVIRLSKADVRDITLSFYKGHECVLVHHNGTYFHRCQETTDSLSFLVHSVIDVHPTLPVWRNDMYPSIFQD